MVPGIMLPGVSISDSAYGVAVALSTFAGGTVLEQQQLMQRKVVLPSTGTSNTAGTG